MSLVEEIRDFGGLPQSTVYRILTHLEAKGLVESHGWPREWRLVDDRQKREAYEVSRLSGLKWARSYTLDDLRRDLELWKHLAEGGDEAIRQFIRCRSTEDFLQETIKLESFSTFLKTEIKLKDIPYLDRRAKQKWYAQLKRDGRHR